MRWHRSVVTEDGSCEIDDDLGPECESFLDGRYIEYLQGHGRAVPSWAWLNQAAHATRPELRAAASAAAPSRWDCVRSALARAVLAAGGDEGSPVDRLFDFQHRVLVPLELQLMSEAEPTPRRILELAYRALYEP